MNIRSLFSTLLLVLASSFAFANSVSGWKPLLSANELNQILQAHSDAVTVIDIRLPNAPDPDSSYNAGHIPGALSSPYGNWRGPAENPGKFLSQSQLTTLVQGLGLTADTPTVVLHKGDSYSDFGAAARVYWTLKTAGLQQLAVVDGGFTAWKQAGLPISKEVTKASPSSYPATIQADWLASTNDVEQQLNRSNTKLLDARPEAFFLGEKWHGAAAKPGTISGADDFDNKQWFRSGGPLLEAPERLQTLVQQNGLDQAEVTVSFCNTGHWAATNWFVLSEVVGQEGVKLYPESMVEWSAAGLPMDNVPGRLKWAWLNTKQWFTNTF
ncbi:MAG: rhodanese-like domain-containing protein [SAR324 cluster bacterium]|nr:rhodanese-like domain-containing protein [SAR324 cluster bacterium]